MTHRPSVQLLLGLLASLGTGCASAPQPRADLPPPTVSDQELKVAEQGLTEFTVELSGTVSSAAPARLQRASYELVVDGKVVEQGEVQLDVAVPANTPTPFQVRESSRYVASAEELAALDKRAGTLLTALRGKLFLDVGGTLQTVDYARSREIRLPRMPKVVLHDMDAGRYSDSEVTGTLYLGVQNPNPFPVKVEALGYQLTIAGKKVTDGALGRGEKVSESSTGVFEVGFTLNEETYGQEVKKLIASRTMPYQAQGELKGELFTLPYALDGEIRLNVSK